MSLVNCNCRCSCALASLIASAVLGVLAAFFQITGLITVAPVFLWVAFGIAVVYLGGLLVASALGRRAEVCGCLRTTLDVLLTGILGTILLSVVLLAVGIVATSVVGAILVGLLVFFFALIFVSASCLVRCYANCGS